MSEFETVKFTVILMCLIIGGIVFFSCLLGYILKSIGNMKCMQKAGEKGWKGWIPFYCDYIMYKLVGLNGWLTLVNVLKTFLSSIYCIFVIITCIFVFNDLEVYYNQNRTKNITYNSSKTSTYSKNISKEEIVEHIDTNQPKYTIISLLSKIVNIFEKLAAIAIFVIHIFFAIKISKAYNLSGGYVAGMILLPSIFLLIIGFGQSKYAGEYKKV